MGLLRNILLLGAAALLLEVGRCLGATKMRSFKGQKWDILRMFKGSSTHSMMYFYTGVSEPIQGISWFAGAGYIDDQLIVSYGNTTRSVVPRVPWMEKVIEEDPQYWDGITFKLQDDEAFFSDYLQRLQNLYHQSTGFHTVQKMYGCELSKDGHTRGFREYSYDGKDFITFDKEASIWRAECDEANVIKREWDTNRADIQQGTFYLENECIEVLLKLLDHGKEELLQRREGPTVKVTRKASSDNMETLVCWVHGFYPKEIDINWKKDGEVWTQDTFREITSPNSDGTYYTRISLKVDPKDRDCYRCHVEHDGLQEPLDQAWEGETAGPAGVDGPLQGPVGLIIGVILGVVLLGGGWLGQSYTVYLH
ncbi:major histocompatibility complex class I-related gene protein-like [Hemicordylus capensis]|uniref:major histocompatibility complex class I-related gene protein-like n=1 Tax=Hemicordylus capensis TaxID=884348 RepID=UPI002302ED01|nr:major histocompatibility complex class I-related gene protein-like [Hemicordylus capensis]